MRDATGPVLDAAPGALDGSREPSDTGASSPPPQRDGGSIALDASCDACARDWKTYPAIVEIDGVSELWAVSDVHADYKAFSKLLVAGGILGSVPASPAAALWTGGQATLVVVGDMIDKGPDAPDVVRLVIALQASAPAFGGRVVATMGNHEAELLADPENSSAAGSNGIDAELVKMGLSPDATAAGQDDIGAFFRRLPIAARVDDWFFVHAGDTAGLTTTELEAALESGIDAMGYAAPIVAAPTSLLEARLSGSPPQWWDTTDAAPALLTEWTAALGAKHLVMGHQPGSVGFADGTNRAATKMVEHYGGLIFLIDTGLSVDVDDTGGALLHVTQVGTASEVYTEVLPSGSVKSL